MYEKKKKKKIETYKETRQRRIRQRRRREERSDDFCIYPLSFAKIGIPIYRILCSFEYTHRILTSTQFCPTKTSLNLQPFSSYLDRQIRIGWNDVQRRLREKEPDRSSRFLLKKQREKVNEGERKEIVATSRIR